MDLRAEQKAERRERILAAARETIGERGYDALTMRDLARAARVTVPTIYNLVGGKEAVLFAAIEEQTARFVAGVENARHESPTSRVLSVVDACTRELLRLPDYYRTLLGILLTSESARPMQRLVDRALAAEVESALDEMAEGGELADWIVPAKLARSLVSQLEFTSTRWAAGELDADGLAAASVYGAGLMLLAVTEGGARSELGERVEDAQSRLGGRRGSRARHAAGKGEV